MAQDIATGGRVLVVDDHPGNRRLLTRLLERQGHVVVTAADGEDALAMVARDPPDLVLMDVMMPRRNGFDTCRELKRLPATRLIPIVLLTALRDSEDKIRGIDAGADDFLTKPVQAAELEARVRSLLRVKRYTDDLESAESVILSMAQTIEARDAYTDGHCRRLAAYGAALGRAIGLGDDDVASLRRGGFLHDIGKIAVPDAVLLKPGPLTAVERGLMEQHPVIGDRLCGGLHSLQRVRPIVRHHHERRDGTGYPDGLRGDAIPLLAQIVGVVDVFDAITTARPYKTAASSERACQELAAEAARGWRRQDLVTAFTSMVEAGALPRVETATVPVSKAPQ